MKLVAVLAVFGWVSAIYWPSMDGPFIFDDQPNIELNESIRWGSDAKTSFGELSFSNPNYRRPVSYATFGLNHFFHGYEVSGYRIVNLLVHCLNGLVMYALVIITLQSPAIRMRRDEASKAAFVAAILFLIHPVAVQSVAYIVQRMNSLATLFYLLSMLLYALGRERKGTRVWFFCASAASGLLATGSKENAATLPLAIVLYEFFFYRNLDWSLFRKHAVPLASLVLITLAIVVLYLGDDPLTRILSGYRHRDFTLIERLLTELRVVVYYLSIFIFPHPSRLNLDHDFLLSTSLLQPTSTIIALLILVGLIIFAITTAKRLRLLAFAILFFFLNLFIESSIVALEIIFEHRTYLPFTFLFASAGYYIVRGVTSERLQILIIALLFVTLSYWTFQRAEVWGSKVRIWEDVVAKSPYKARPRQNLGVALRDEARYLEAIPQFERALELDPDHIMARQNLADALYNVGDYATALGRFKEVTDQDDDFAKGHLGQGNCLYEMDRIRDAIKPWTRYLELQPADAKVHLKIGIAFAEIDQDEAAMQHLRRAADLDSNNVIARWNLAIVMFNRRNDANEVIKLLEEASRLDPLNANILSDLGLVLSETPRRNEAVPILKKAIAIDNDHPAATQLLQELQ